MISVEVRIDENKVIVGCESTNPEMAFEILIQGLASQALHVQEYKEWDDERLYAEISNRISGALLSIGRLEIVSIDD